MHLGSESCFCCQRPGRPLLGWGGSVRLLVPLACHRSCIACHRSCIACHRSCIACHRSCISRGLLPRTALHRHARTQGAHAVGRMAWNSEWSPRHRMADWSDTIWQTGSTPVPGGTQLSCIRTRIRLGRTRELTLVSRPGELLARLRWSSHLQACPRGMQDPAAVGRSHNSSARSSLRSC